jgi:uncharacterized glyoxalase superfamily protein PhnB
MDTTTTTDTTPPGAGTPLPKAIWPCLSYADARSAIDFLVEAFGFEASLVVPGEDDPTLVVHSQLLWPEGGGVMVGSAGVGEEPFASHPTGAGSTYVVTDHPDALHERALAAGATEVRGLRDEAYGSRGFTVTDPEGNIWSFGTYRGE